jgi:hypothetical protein
MNAWLKTMAVLTAGGLGAWFALRALVPQGKAPPPPALETWEGEGGNLAPNAAATDARAS